MIKELRSGWRAFWFNNTASLFNISLKRKFDPLHVKEDYLIEDVLQRNFQNGVLPTQKSALDFNFYELDSKMVEMILIKPFLMRIQTKQEEQLNAISHGVGALLGIAGLILLIVSRNVDAKWSLFSVIVYGLSIVILFTASTLYHSVTSEKRKHYFRIVDHISIYLLIAGTYTPVLLLLLNDSLGWTLFWVVWGIAVFGVILKLFFTGKFETFSTLLYLVMGWLIVFDYSNVAEALTQNGVWLLFAGGLFYTVGIIFYAFERIPYNHVIWHLLYLVVRFATFLWYYFMLSKRLFAFNKFKASFFTALLNF